MSTVKEVEQTNVKHKEVKGKSSFYPVEGTLLRCFMTYYLTILRKFHVIKVKKNDTKPHFSAGHLSINEKQALARLKSNQDINIRLADKRGGIELQNYSDYHVESLRILSDAEYYQKINYDPFPIRQNSLQELKTEAQQN